jgi:hypothetical protein
MTVKLAMVLACLAAALAGCGGARLSPVEARFAAALKAACLALDEGGAIADLPRVAARYRAAKAAARNSPRVAALLSDWAMERKLQAEIERETAHGSIHPRKPGETRFTSLEADARRLARKTLPLEKTLGFKLCLGSHATRAESVVPSPQSSTPAPSTTPEAPKPN